MLRTRWALLLSVTLSLAACESRQEPRPEERPRAAPETIPADRTTERLQPVGTGHLINAIEIEELREQGLRDPVSQIVDSLMAHPELIPHEGVLGGTMGFYSPTYIHILDGSWIFADFDDGHIMGRGVFSYAVQPDSSLTFRVVHSEIR